MKYQTDGQKFEKKEFDYAKGHVRVLKQFRREGKLLDVGCSVGFFLSCLKQEGWEGWGLEVSADAADFAEKKYGLKVFKGVIEETNEFPAQSFDVITLWDLIEHTLDPLTTMKKVNALLKDHGLIFLSTPNVDGLFPRLSYLAAKMIHIWPHPEPPHHLFCFSKTTVINLLKKTGFVPVKVVHRRIMISYTFGNLKTIFHSWRSLLYSLVFIPIVLLGELFHSGDEIIVVAKKQGH
ncbi:MAG: class I SAM-dependent methyltransferase [Candidatus Omnitrophica bacterium]|nr:class I SAM-dependent methyltransferase [Candidatus Omnitrophota bacterium]